MPQNEAGWRIEPPVSVPVAPRQSPAATAAADPPELPPGTRGWSRPDFSPWINDRSEVAGDVGRTHGELVQVGLADQDRARLPELARDGRFVGRDEAVQDVGAGGRPDARRAEQILDRERDAFERARLAAAEPAIGLGRHLERALRRLGDEGVQPACRLDRPDVRERQLARRELLRPQAGARRREREAREIAHSTTFGTTK